MGPEHFVDRNMAFLLFSKTKAFQDFAITFSICQLTGQKKKKIPSDFSSFWHFPRKFWDEDSVSNYFNGL